MKLRMLHIMIKEKVTSHEDFYLRIRLEKTRVKNIR